MREDAPSGHQTAPFLRYYDVRLMFFHGNHPAPTLCIAWRKSEEEELRAELAADTIRRRNTHQRTRRRESLKKIRQEDLVNSREGI